jgi:tRNA dimethylallyltransferase
LFTGSPADPAIRAALRAEAEHTGWKALYERLQRIDPEAVRRIHPNDRHRTMRALEVFELTGKPLSEWQKEHAFADSCFDTITIGLDRDRADLYEAINRRCDEMIQAGLLGELTALVVRGYGLDLPALQSVGYRHMGMVLRGELPLESATDLMKRDTRRLAKRQWTWFRNDRDTRWFHPAESPKIRAIVERFFEQTRA